MTTGEKIAFHRKKLGMTQQQFADSLGVSRQAVSRWEGDLAFPETETLLKMSDMFGCTVDYLLRYNGDDGAEQADSTEQANGATQAADGGNTQSAYSDGDPHSAQATQPERGKFVIDLNKLHFEYKSKTTLFGVPLVHINIGLFAVAKGIIAIGPVAVGFLSIGVFGIGLLALSCFALGGFALGAIAMGLLSFGGVSIGLIAMGGVAIGLYSFGGCSIGLFAVGGYANGHFVAVGDYAVGDIAFGETTAIGYKISVTSENYSELRDSAFSQIDALPPFWNGFKEWIKHFVDMFMRRV